MVDIWHKLVDGFSLSVKRENDLLGQLFVELDARFESIKHRGGEALRGHALVSEIETRLGGERTWLNGQHIEQLLVSLLDEEELRVELARLATDNARYEEVSAQLAREEGEAGEAAIALTRALVHRLLQDRHWHFETERLDAAYRRSTRRRVSFVFALAVFAFFGPKLLPEISEKIFLFENDPKKLLLFSAVTAGMLGACFSMLTSLENRLASADLDSLRSLSSFSSLFFRIFAGAAGGLVLFYFIDSNLIAGDLLPDLRELKGDVASKDKSLLILLCFAAGFSEKLIASVLTKARGSVEK